MGMLCPRILLAEEMPLLKKGGVYQLPVEINGVITLHFILDTGASDVNISADVVLTLHRAGTVRDADFLPGKTYTLADGSTVKSERFLLRSLKIGHRRVVNVTASIGPISGALLLGQSFLEKLGAWGIASQRQVLTLGTQRQRKELPPRLIPPSLPGGPQVADNNSSPLPAAPQTLRNSNVIKFGVSTPLSGPAAPWGIPHKQAIELVFDEINGKGGLKSAARGISWKWWPMITGM